MAAMTRGTEARNGPWLGLALLCIVTPSVLVLQACAGARASDSGTTADKEYVLAFLQAEASCISAIPKTVGPLKKTDVLHVVNACTKCTLTLKVKFISGGPFRVFNEVENDVGFVLAPGEEQRLTLGPKVKKAKIRLVVTSSDPNCGWCLTPDVDEGPGMEIDP